MCEGATCVEAGFGHHSGVGRAFSSYIDWMEAAFNRLDKDQFVEWVVIGYLET